MAPIIGDYLAHMIDKESEQLSDDNYKLLKTICS